LRSFIDRLIHRDPSGSQAANSGIRAATGQALTRPRCTTGSASTQTPHAGTTVPATPLRSLLPMGPGDLYCTRSEMSYGSPALLAGCAHAVG
jgi:hypothetical protein